MVNNLKKQKKMNNKLSMFNLLFEGEIQTNEQPTGIKSGLKHADYVAKLAQIFKVNSKFVMGALKNGEKAALSKVKSASKAFVKTADVTTLAKYGDEIPLAVKNASKELAITRLYEKTQQGNKSLTRAQVQSIVDETKAEVKLIFSNAKNGGSNLRNSASSEGVTRWFSYLFKGGKSKPRVKVNSSESASILGKAWRTLMTTRKVLIVTSIVAFGYAGYVLIQALQDVLGVDPLPDLDDADVPKSVQDWKRCIVDALEGKYDATGGVDPVGVYLQITVSEYAGKQTGGWVKFYSDYRLKTASGLSGSWDCSQDAVKSLNEQDDTTTETDNDVETMIDLLDFPVSSSDLESAHGLLKKYVSNGRGKEFLDLYRRSGLGLGDGGTLTKTLKYIVTSKARSTRLKGEMLSMISKIEQGSTSVEDGGNNNSSTSHMTVVWDDNNVTDTTPPKPNEDKIRYRQCDDFPFDLGCINEKIKDIQRCLTTSNLKVDGYYGPLTNRAILNVDGFAGFDNKKLITKEIYDGIISKFCGKDDDTKIADARPQSDLEKDSERNLSQIEPKGIVLPSYDTEIVIQKFGKDKLDSIINMTIDDMKIRDLYKRLRFSNGRYRLDVDETLTEKQLDALNKYMSGKGFTISDSERNLRRGKYVWIADDRDSRRIARKERDIERIKSNINEE